MLILNTYIVNDSRKAFMSHSETTCHSLCDPQSQLNAMKLNRLHAATMAPAPSQIKTREEKGEMRSHQRARRGSSDDNSRPKAANRISTIPELTESFEKKLYLRDKRTMSLVKVTTLSSLPVLCPSTACQRLSSELQV